MGFKEFFSKIFSSGEKKETGVFSSRDEEITCKDCGKDFLFSASEKEFFASKGFQNKPVRCKECRQSRKKKRSSRSSRGAGKSSKGHKIVCDRCGCTDYVPFKPSNDKPVFCDDCFHSDKQ